LNRIMVTPDDLALEREAVQADIRGSRLPGLLTQCDPGPYGLTGEILELLGAVEQGMAVCRSLRPRCRTVLGDPTASCLSLWVAAQTVLGELPVPEGAHIRVGGGFPERDVLILADQETLSHGLMADYTAYLSFYRGHAQADKRVDVPGGPVRCTQAYFQLLGQSLARVLKGQPSWDLVERTHVEVPRHRYRGLQPIEAAAGPAELLDVTLDDIVGNEEFGRAGMRLARDVAGFDFETRQNPKRLNPILFAMGDPGCGKTVTCHAIGRYFLDFCKAHEIPAKFLVIRRSDWASSYQNASAAQLIDIFKNQVAAFPGVVGVYWPDIDTAFAAREDPGVRSEEKNILGACFGIFDGTIIPKNGQWFMLCDANTLNMDRAAISRITQDPFTLHGPVSADDFVALLRDKKLRSHNEFIPLSTEQWKQVGDACIELELSGRSIENISRRVITEIEDFEYPDEYFQAPLARRLEILKEQSHRIAAERLLAILQHYKTFEREAEERAYRSKFQDRVQEIVFNMSAQAAAVAATHPPG
jgi:hypothetical protein